MCNLDLAKAFDTVPHNELYASMQDAGIPEALSRIILHVHTRTTCIIDHGGVRRAVGMGRGLRQGCPISPVIYACFTARLCRMLDQRLGRGWCQAHLSAFADDTHGFWQLHTPDDFHRARRELYTVISTLHTLGMSINTTKSIAVVIMRGKAPRCSTSATFAPSMAPKICAYSLRMPVTSTSHVPRAWNT